MRTLRLFRYSFKTGEFINPEGFALIEAKKGDYFNCNKMFVSPYTRTVQTAAGILAASNQKTTKIIQIDGLMAEEAVKMLLGNQAFFGPYRKNPDEEIYNLLDEFFKEGEIKRMELICSLAIEKCFSKMKDGDQSMAVGHSPLVTFAANYFAKTRLFGNLKELDYVDFFKNGEKIYVKK